MSRQQSTPETRSVRLLKVGEQVRHVISELLSRQMVHDEVLSAHSVSVTEVRMSPDLRHAAVFVKPLLGADEALVLKALRTNTAFFQKEVAGKLRAGMVAINNWGPTPGAPFGGYKQSGNGREGGLAGLKDFMEMKAISGLPA